MKTLSQRNETDELQAGPDVLCFAHGRPGDWEAFCVDFDIAVQGESFRRVQQELELAVADYVRALNDEQPAARRLLSRRRAPRLTTLWWSVRVVTSALRHFFGVESDTTASFPVAVRV